MPSDDLTPTRWRPRFSVRTLVVSVTLVCAYAACWGPTKGWGCHQISHEIRFPGYDTTAVAPLLISQEKHDEHYRFVRRYYFWFFGVW